MEIAKKCPECGTKTNEPRQTICYECGCYLVSEIRDRLLNEKRKEISRFKEESGSIFFGPDEIDEQFHEREIESIDKNISTLLKKLVIRNRELERKKQVGEITSDQKFELENINNQIDEFKDVFGSKVDKALGKLGKEMEKEGGFTGFLGSIISPLEEEEKPKPKPKPREKTPAQKAHDEQKERDEIYKERKKARLESMSEMRDDINTFYDKKLEKLKERLFKDEISGTRYDEEKEALERERKNELRKLEGGE